ncbi:hypothetical protein C8Q74DRAFT_1220239 [Fomes fomentarius]|nr:hypothetical protein C8Q74DRAFT_1220239 [Fomes fomentarius]
MGKRSVCNHMAAVGVVMRLASPEVQLSELPSASSYKPRKKHGTRPWDTKSDFGITWVAHAALEEAVIGRSGTRISAARAESEFNVGTRHIIPMNYLLIYSPHTQLICSPRIKERQSAGPVVRSTVPETPASGYWCSQTLTKFERVHERGWTPDTAYPLIHNVLLRGRGCFLALQLKYSHSHSLLLVEPTEYDPSSVLQLLSSRLSYVEGIRTKKRRPPDLQYLTFGSGDQMGAKLQERRDHTNFSTQSASLCGALPRCSLHPALRVRLCLSGNVVRECDTKKLTYGTDDIDDTSLARKTRSCGDRTRRTTCGLCSLDNLAGMSRIAGSAGAIVVGDSDDLDGIGIPQPEQSSEGQNTTLSRSLRFMNMISHGHSRR